MNRSLLQDKRWIWVLLGIITLIIRYVLSPKWIESFYSRGLFLWIRRLIDNTIGYFPFPLIYLFFVLLVIFLIIRIKKSNFKQLWSFKGITSTLFSIFAFLGGALFFFFFLWGFNYGRISLVQQLDLSPTPLPVEELKAELDNITTLVLSAREALDPDTLALEESLIPEDLENLTRSEVEKTLLKLGYPVHGKVRGRILFPKGIFLRFSSAGLYWPFVGEGNIDGGLHHLQRPFTLAHELSHGYGITNEGVCNFLAYLACKDAQNPFIRYSGLLSYWRYLAIAFQRFERDKYWAFRKTLPLGFQADLDAINENLEKYPDIFPQVRYMAYDAYLKSQGISEGMKSYSQIIMLVKAWDKKQGN